MVTLLVKALADINAVSKQGETALFEACLKGHLRVVDVLLQFNADVNLANNDGITPLIVSAAEGHAMVSKALLAAGADCNRKDQVNYYYLRFSGFSFQQNGYSALYRACERNNGKIVEQLIDAGANLDGLNQVCMLLTYWGLCIQVC